MSMVEGSQMLLIKTTEEGPPEAIFGAAPHILGLECQDLGARTISSLCSLQSGSAQLPQLWLQCVQVQLRWSLWRTQVGSRGGLHKVPTLQAHGV